MGVPTSEDPIERAYREWGTQLWRGIYAFSDGRADIADDAVAEAFARALEPQQRAVVFLFYYADLSIADIAGATGSSRASVRVQLHRAREALRRRYATAAAMRASSPGGSDEQQLV